MEGNPFPVEYFAGILATTTKTEWNFNGANITSADLAKILTSIDQNPNRIQWESSSGFFLDCSRSDLSSNFSILKDLLLKSKNIYKLNLTNSST